MSSEAIQPALMVLPCAALAAGALLAQFSAPLTCSWGMKLDELKTRLLALRHDAPSARRSIIGTLAVGAVLMGGAMAAYATVPAAPARLAAGTATPRKGGPVRLVSFNARGEAATETRAAVVNSQENVQGPAPRTLSDVLRREIESGRWDGRPAWGLDQADTSQLILYDAVRDRAYAAWYAKNWLPGVEAMDIPFRPTEEEVLGAAYGDYSQLNERRTQYRVAHYAEEMAMPLAGPSSILVPAGMTPGEAITSVGASPAGVWTFGAADTQGGRLMSRVSSPTYAAGVFTSAMAMANVGAPDQ